MLKNLEYHSTEEKGQAWVEDGFSYVVNANCPLCGRSRLKDVLLIQACISSLTIESRSF